MLFYDNLETIIFNRHQHFACDEFVVLSGYVGPEPIRRLKNLNLKSTVIYGMYGSDGISNGLHSILLQENKTSPSLNILYSTRPVHSKCYIWKSRGKVVHALVGSANFTLNGLTTTDREVLAETTSDTFKPIDRYIKNVIRNTVPCSRATPGHKKDVSSVENSTTFNPNICTLPLYVTRKDGNKETPPRSGINWGHAKKKNSQSEGSHVNINDAEIRIHAYSVQNYPHFFPAKQSEPVLSKNIARHNHRHNDNIEIIWDDGECMTGLLEGNLEQNVNGQKMFFPKQISTTPKKSILGLYLRKRLGVPSGHFVTYNDLQRYGRDSIDVSLLGQGVYYFDFSV